MRLVAIISGAFWPGSFPGHKRSGAYPPLLPSTVVLALDGAGAASKLSIILSCSVRMDWQDQIVTGLSDTGGITPTRPGGNPSRTNERGLNVVKLL